MLSSSSTFFIPPSHFSSSSPSRPKSTISTPPRVSPTSRSLYTTSASYTCVDDQPRIRQLPQRFSATASLYEILGVPIGSTSQEIKSAYRRLARIYHPDVAGKGRNNSSDAFMKIHAAYFTLSDPEKRAVYDRRILSSSRPSTAGVSRFRSYHGRRNWETDQCW